MDRLSQFNLLARAKSLHLVSSRLLEGLISGNYRTVFRGPGIEFDEVREYADTDDVRSIDWNVSSRMGSPYTKTYKEEREIALFLILDVSASMRLGSTDMSKMDTANMVAALLCFSAIYNSDRVGALFFSDIVEKVVPLSRRQTHASRLIRDIALFEPKGRGSDMSLALRIVYESLTRRGICVIVSDFRTNTGSKELLLLSRKHDVIAIKIGDPLDMSFPPTGLISLTDPESGSQILSYSRSKAYQREYREFWEHEHTLWQRKCRKIGVDTLTVGTDEDPAQKLLTFFNRRRRRHR